MRKGFDNAFDDFLTERMGEEIARLKEKNKTYKSALAEYSELIDNAQRIKDEDYREAFDRLSELSVYIRDLENRYLFYSGMATHRRMDDMLSNVDLPDRFTD